MINGGSINSFAINAAGGVPAIPETIADDLSLDDVLTMSRTIQLLEDLTVSGTWLTDVIFGLTEAISMSDTLSSNATVNNIVTSEFNLDDVLKYSLTLLITEDITVNHAQVVTGILLEGLADIFNSGDSVSNQIAAMSVLALNITLADAVYHGFSQVLLEDVSVNHVTLDMLEALSGILEDLTVSLSQGNVVLINSLVLEDFTLDDSNSVGQVLFDSVLENITMMVSGEGGDTYSGWVLNPETFAIWNYDNHNFNSMATLGGTTFFANSTGLFKMGGTLDDTSFIQSRLKTASLSFGSSNLKQVPDMYIGMNLVGEMVIGVTTDERINVKYKLVTPSTVQEMQTVKLGKGLRGNLWQFELIDDKATALDITSIEWVPVVFGRKRR